MEEHEFSKKQLVKIDLKLCCLLCKDADICVDTYRKVDSKGQLFDDFNHYIYCNNALKCRPYHDEAEAAKIETIIGQIFHKPSRKEIAQRLAKADAERKKKLETYYSKEENK